MGYTPSYYVVATEKVPEQHMSRKCSKFSHFRWGYLASNSSVEQTETDLHGWNNISSSIDKVSFKSNSISLGLVLLEKLFAYTLE